jgi:hypothetical protein
MSAFHRLVEFGQIVPGIIPVNLATAANPGDWVSMALYSHLTVIFFKGVGTAGEDPVLTISQATSNAGAGSKALNVDRYYKKEGATLVSAIGQFTEVLLDPATNVIGGAAEATSAENEVVWVIEIEADQLDTNGGFSFVQVSCADAGAGAQVGALLYILTGARYPQKAALSAIA